MRKLSIKQLTPGMVIGRTIFNERGDTLLVKGVTVTRHHIDALTARGYHWLYVQDRATDGIVPDSIVSDTLRAETARQVAKIVAEVDHTPDAASAEVEREAQTRVRESLKSPEFARAVSSVPNVGALTNLISSILDEAMDATTLSGLTTIRSHDDYTYQHSVDVTLTSVMIGRRLMMDRSELAELAMACLLHDVGNTLVDPALLAKPAALSPEEFSQVQQHTVYGYEILRQLQKDFVFASHVAYQHHERQDGTGYPRQLRGHNRVARAPGTTGAGYIVLMAEIAAVADVYDALSSDRPYRAAFRPEDAVAMVREMAGTKLNREVVAQFLSILPIFPVGQEVVVTAGPYRSFRGVVARQNQKALDRPVVRLVSDARRRDIEPSEIDLSAAKFADTLIASA